ncbi:MAG: M28 family peptidase [Bacteroidales bacterium]|nr:M28 family peptidase [Bacteroidales bacterium]
MKHTFYLASLLFSLNLLSGCSNTDVQNAEDSINTADLVNYVKVLGSDAFMGRKPCTVGEDSTMAYLKREFIRLGLEPGFGESYFQEVPLVEVSCQPSEQMRINTGGQNLELKYIDDFVVFSKRIQEQTNLENVPMVFAGFGIVAPEYNRNDYAGIDVKGKVVVVLVNDPGYNSGDSTNFKGNIMTYYGRWTYKYEEAARQGATGVLIVHETPQAGYPWSVVVSGATASKFYLQPDDGYKDRCEIEGWITRDAAVKLFTGQNQRLDSLIAMARRPDFKPVEMDASVSVSMISGFTNKLSHNIMAVLPGTARPGEVIIYSGHWDHFGVGTPLNGDSIYNGAVDNGTTLAWMMEIAEAFTKLKDKPERSIAFFAPTGEEQGLLGSAWYVEHPSFELSKTVANINNDLMLYYGRMKDVMVTGYGQSELEDYLKEFADLQNRYILPDPNPETGMYFRGDQFSFAKAGVPGLYARGNCDSREHGKEWMHQKEKEWLANNYHKPTDQYDVGWDLSGVEEDAKLLFRVGLKLANETTFPGWKEGSEFKRK